MLILVLDILYICSAVETTNFTKPKLEIFSFSNCKRFMIRKAPQREYSGDWHKCNSPGFLQNWIRSGKQNTNILLKCLRQLTPFYLRNKLYQELNSNHAYKNGDTWEQE